MTEIVLPILLPFALIILLVFIRKVNYAKWIGIIGSALIAIVAIYIFINTLNNGVLVLYVGGWKAPYGITLVVDMLSGIMLVVTSFLVLSISIYAYHFIKNNKQFSRFFLFFFALIMGVNGTFVTGDIFNFYVWLEVIMLSSFVLITMGSEKKQLEGGIKYMALNLIASLFFLAGIGLLYGKTGTLNMAHLAKILTNDQQSLFMNTSAMLFFIALGIKAAIFPLFFWLPASYHTANITVTSLFAGILTKVGVYAFIRFFTLFFVQDAYFWHNLLLICAGFTMVIGGMAASIQYDVRRILSYHIISQIGYMIMGLGIYTPLAIAGAIFFTVHNMIAKTNTFLVSGIMNKLKGTFDLKSMGSLLKEQPLLAVLFIIPAFALAGIPPLSGFFAKFILIKSGIEDGHYVIIAIAVLTSLLTLYSMIKIWSEAFLKKQPDAITIPNNEPIGFTVFIPSIMLALGSVLLGVFAASFFDLTMEAARQLMEPSEYINAVLGADVK
ncbi:proton-conducting transporter membrane subunit [Saccharicrinis aurantiacus]|uniref:proton-conducting transporter transmembrane domain-containing protein n=1 Tax=Saccharicrinis aurantiacus TaxID=1849719 RepID=UPI00248F809E|nr:proton-conducting transporter membrane subunit [Saccharicrinis aurantiacus]